jgi:hypothetical protein
MEGGSFTRDFERWMKGAPEVECLSLRELCEENLEEGLLCWGSGRIWGRDFRGWASPSVEALLGCRGGGVVGAIRGEL